MLNLKELNAQQKEAITHKEGPLLIIAGAGTGKTKVITYRIAYLIEKGLALPSEILALTFTEKAAKEMEERVDLLLPYGIFDVDIMTFHSFGEKILKEYSTLLGLPSDFKLLNKLDQLIFLRDNIYELPLKILRPVTNPTSHLHHLSVLFSRLKEENISPKKYLNWAKKNLEKEKKKNDEARIEKAKIHLEGARAYQKYQELLKKEGAVDFADLIYLSYHLLKKHSSVREKIRNKYKYILVDEFQDTNYLQNELLKLLINEKQNITVVGDDDQSIFRWRGASLSNIITFQKDFPKTKKIVLSQNYRSPQEILDSAYKVIQNNNPYRLEVKSKVNKRLIGEFSSKDSIIFKSFDHVHSESDFIVNEIKKAIKKNIPLREIAILLRSNNLANHYIKNLNSAGIPYVFSGESGIYFKPEVSMLVSLVKAITSNNDRLAYYNLAQSEAYDINLEDLTEIFDFIKRHNLSVFKTLKNIRKYQNYLNLESDTVEKIELLAKDIEELRKTSKELSAGQIIYKFLKEKGILKKLNEVQSIENEIKIKNIADFFKQIVLEFEKASNNHSIHHLGEYLEDLLSVYSSPEIEELDPDFEAVRILTFHAAKGLEFKIVFMPALTSDYIPSRDKTEILEIPEEFIHEILLPNDYHLQEERRLFYVGITRAKKKLFLTYALDYGGKRAKKPSPFLYEALGKETILKDQKLKLPQLEQINIFSFEGKKKSQLLSPKSPLVLSYSSIDDYLTCPLKYKFVKILRIPVLQSFAVAFGSSIHETINEYYKNLINGRKLSEEEILKIFKRKWQTEGYLHKKHEKEAFKEAKKAIRNFYSHKLSRIVPDATEKSFSIPIGDDILKVKFDLLFKGKKGVKILDFKTSFTSKKKAQERAQKSLQLKIYAWAYNKIENVLPSSLGLVFVNMRPIYIAKAFFSEKQLQDVEEKIKKVSQNIKEEKFDPTPSAFACSYCAFRENCPFAYR